MTPTNARQRTARGLRAGWRMAKDTYGVGLVLGFVAVVLAIMAPIVFAYALVTPGRGQDGAAPA